ncbi:MAG: corrinoid protein [bacterium]
MSDKFGLIAESLIAGNVDEVTKLTKECLEEAGPDEVLQKGLLAGMEVVGQRFKVGDMFIPEVMRCAKAMRGAMDILRPKLIESDIPTAGTFVIGTVKGDLHDIGKNLVLMMYEGAGFRTVNLGVDLDTEVFVNAVKEEKPDILGMSALLTTTMPRMGEVINALKEAGIRDQVKIIVGGAPVTSDYAEQIGADAYGANAAMAVDVGRSLLD